MPMQYTENFLVIKMQIFDIFLIFAQNIAVLMSTHNLCFGVKIRKIGIPLQTPVFYIKVGFKGVFITRTCFLGGYRGLQAELQTW